MGMSSQCCPAGERDLADPVVAHHASPNAGGAFCDLDDVHDRYDDGGGGRALMPISDRCCGFD
jgi:hypothetical protein